MQNYIINKNQDSKSYNEVHTTDCNHQPEIYNRVSIGWHANSLEAVACAKQIGWKNTDGCYYCCNESHRG